MPFVRKVDFWVSFSTRLKVLLWGVNRVWKKTKLSLQIGAEIDFFYWCINHLKPRSVVCLHSRRSCLYPQRDQVLLHGVFQRHVSTVTQTQPIRTQVPERDLYVFRCHHRRRWDKTTMRLVLQFIVIHNAGLCIWIPSNWIHDIISLTSNCVGFSGI